MIVDSPRITVTGVTVAEQVLEDGMSQEDQKENGQSEEITRVQKQSNLSRANNCIETHL